MRIGCVVDGRSCDWLSDHVASLAEVGCRGVFVRGLGTVLDGAGERLARLRAWPGAGLALIGIECDLYACADGDASLARTTERLEQYARQIAAVRAEAIVLTGGPRGGRAIGEFQELLDEACGRFAPLGLGVCIANRKGTCVEQIEDLRAIFTPPRHTHIRLLLDAGECYEATVNPRDVFAELGDWTAGVVLSDRRTGSKVGLGTGRVNVAGFVTDLARSGYDGWVVLDVPWTAHGPWLDALRQAVTHVHELHESHRHSH